MKIKLIIPLLLLSGCSLADDTEASNFHLPFFGSKTEQKTVEKPAELVALQYIHYGEKTHRNELKELLGIDPRQIEWCAAFVNAVLEESGVKSNIDSSNPYMARSFLSWGKKVSKKEIQPGDIVIFPRGNVFWQGHVGFYMRSQMIKGTLYYYILGGNQKNKVSIVLYPASQAIGIRRAKP